MPRSTRFRSLKLLLAAVLLAPWTSPFGQNLQPIEQLGRFLYFDTNLSEPAGQSCASCHLPAAGFDDPDRRLPVSEGVIPGLFGGRNSPASAYAMYAPMFHFDPLRNNWVGGQFWDGRATGEVLGDPLADQALGPFLNPVEMANPDKATVIRDVRDSRYAALFEEVWGPAALDDVDRAYDQVALSIAAFERTRLFGRFTSKYDAYLQACVAAGDASQAALDACARGQGDAAEAASGLFSRQEWRGLQLFMGANNNDGVYDTGEGANCAICHTPDWTQALGQLAIPDWAPQGMVPPVFSSFAYVNIGIPKSDHRLLRDNPVDLGLGGVLLDATHNGKFKIMTLRNIAETAPYGHNGLFRSLLQITRFYNARDVGRWPAPEVPENVNTRLLGNLGLSVRDEQALVRFMETLSDGYSAD